MANQHDSKGIVESAFDIALKKAMDALAAQRRAEQALADANEARDKAHDDGTFKGEVAKSIRDNWNNAYYAYGLASVNCIAMYIALDNCQRAITQDMLNRIALAKAALPTHDRKNWASAPSGSGGGSSTSKTAAAGTATAHET